MIHPVAQKLFEKRNKKKDLIYIEKAEVISWLEQITIILYPHFSKLKVNNIADLSLYIRESRIKLHRLFNLVMNDERSHQIADDFYEHIGDLSDTLDQDAQAICEGDPAARNCNEVVFCYPGFLAIMIHRIAHFLYKAQVPIYPRMISEYAHQSTGIDIHPGATIGDNFFIDHGTGVVIGETANIGNNVKIYQGVTLGALSVKKTIQGQKRHPTIEDGVVIYANATILGGKTIIGRDSIIGGNVWLTESVEPNSLVYHQNEIKMTSKNK